MSDPGRLAVADALCQIMAARHPGTQWVALARYGLLRTLQRVTNSRWTPVEKQEAA